MRLYCEEPKADADDNIPNTARLLKQAMPEIGRTYIIEPPFANN